MTTQTVIALIVMHAKMFGVDPDLAVSVARVESSFNIHAVGGVGEVGLFQIRPEFNKEYTKAQLKDPNINALVGVKMLANLKKTCVHNQGIDFLVCYNYGPVNAKKVKNPSKFPYVVKVRKEMDAYKLKRIAQERMIAAENKAKNRSLFEEFLDSINRR